MSPQNDNLAGLTLPPIDQVQPAHGHNSNNAAPMTPTPVVPPVANDTQTAIAPAAAPVAVKADEGTDDLDQEWINKAKTIVEQTKGDPYLESRELGKVKSDYLGIRYNKHIKVAEDHIQ